MSKLVIGGMCEAPAAVECVRVVPVVPHDLLLAEARAVVRVVLTKCDGLILRKFKLM